jgi:hypothetical protein
MLAGGAVRKKLAGHDRLLSEGGPQPHKSWLGAIHVGGLWPVCSGAKVVVRGYTTISEQKESVTSET